MMVAEVVLTMFGSALLAPHASAQSDTVVVERDLPYASVGEVGEVLKLDVYRLPSTTSGPVVISLHGGSGSKDDGDYVELSRRLAVEGFVVFNVSFEASSPRGYLADGARLLRSALESVTCSVRFASARASEFGGDTGSLTVLGHSAGGYFGLMASLLDGDSELPWSRLPQAPPSEATCTEGGGSAEVTGFVGMNGAYFVFAFFGLPQSDPLLWEVVNPRSYVDRRASLVTRFLIGSEDPATPPQHVDMVEAFSEARSGLGFDSEVIVIETDHDYAFTAPEWEATLDAIRTAARGR